eukprot:617291-Karenia_brevis.AAC.1
MEIEKPDSEMRVAESATKPVVKKEGVSPEMKQKLSSIKRTLDFASKAEVHEIPSHDSQSSSSQMDSSKRPNQSAHSPYSPLKGFQRASDDGEPTLSEIMQVLLEQGQKMATKQDLREVHKEIMRDTRVEIAHAVDPLKDQLKELQDRVQKNE